MENKRDPPCSSGSGPHGREQVGRSRGRGGRKTQVQTTCELPLLSGRPGGWFSSSLLESERITTFLWASRAGPVSGDTRHPPGGSRGGGRARHPASGHHRQRGHPIAPSLSRALGWSEVQGQRRGAGGRRSNARSSDCGRSQSPSSFAGADAAGWGKEVIVFTVQTKILRLREAK